MNTRNLKAFARKYLPASTVDRLRRTRDDWRARQRGRRKRRETDEHARNRTVRALEVQLWEGDDPTAEDRLRLQSDSSQAGTRERWETDLALARWSIARGNHQAALDRLNTIETAEPRLRMIVDALTVDCLCPLGQPKEALRVLARHIGKTTDEADLLLRLGYARSQLAPLPDRGSGAVVESLNRILDNGGYVPLRRDDVSRAPSIDNVVAYAPRVADLEPLPLVTVLIEVSSRSNSAAMSLRSISNQTWHRLEIVVVDRSSDPDVRAFVSDFIGEDRLLVITRPNLQDESSLLADGLSHATGEYATTVRQGSWVHPQRIEKQIRALIRRPDRTHSGASHLRISPPFRPTHPGLRPQRALIGPDPDSLMFKVRSETDLDALESAMADFSRTSGLPRWRRRTLWVSPDVPLTLSPELNTGQKMNST